jgi:chromosome segregation ATPase
MVQPDFGGLDTPRTNIGDATYLSRAPDFDISQEPSFQSPSKDANVFQAMRNGGRSNLKTPRGSRAPFGDRRNLPAGIGGAEFTPLLKSATRNSSRRFSGKENGLVTPAFLDKIEEDMTPVPRGEISTYGASRSGSSYLEATPLPQVDSSSLPSTPMIMKTRKEGNGPLQDGNQLSLREQENVIDRIEKENFGLKLKIHFLEDALRKAGPGFSEATLKENTDLKVDRVTMQRELSRYKKHLTTAEKDLEEYRHQILEMQEKAKRKFTDESQRLEMEKLRRELAGREADIEELQRHIDQGQHDSDKIDKLQDDIGDLEAEVREKDRVITKHEDEIEDLRIRAETAEERMKDAQRRMIELEEKAQANDKLEEAKDTISDLEADVRRLEQQVDDLKEKFDDAVSEKERAEGDLEELQEEMANKSVVTKGLSRQVEEKIARLQGEVDKARNEYVQLQGQHDAKSKEADDLKLKVKESRQARDAAESEARSLSVKLEEIDSELNISRDQKSLLQARQDALTNESESLQRELLKLQKSASQLEEDLRQEREHSLGIERDIRSQFKDEIDGLNDEISDLQAEVRERENLYDNDSEKWESERRGLEAQRDEAEQRAAGLQRTIEKLREAEGTLSHKELKLQEAIDSETERHQGEESVLRRRIQDLQEDLDARQGMLQDVRNELSAVQDELRQAQLDHRTQKTKAEGLEDEVEILQASIDEEAEKARHDIAAAQAQCDSLKVQLAATRESATTARASIASNQDKAQHAELMERLTTQSADTLATLAKVNKEKQALQDQLATINIELHSLRTQLAQTKAERNELENQAQRRKEHDDETFRLDQERVELRTAKLKLDHELRRLKDENQSLLEQRDSVEKTLEEEIEKAAVEEERLGHEIRQLQAKLRQAGESQDLSAARRTIRELEHQVEDLEAQLAATAPLPAMDGNSEISIIRRDLSDARSKEREYLRREIEHKEVVKTLRRQVADLERAAHQAEMKRLASSPSSEASSGRKAELSELRHQLSTAHQSIYDLKKSLRDAERHASEAAVELRSQVTGAQEEKLALEQALEDVQIVADEAAEVHEIAIEKYKVKLERYKRERDFIAQQLEDAKNRTVDSDVGREARKDLNAMLRKTQIQAAALEREVREHKDSLDEVKQSEMSLRDKLDRVRRERATFRADAERLQREVESLQSSRKQQQFHDNTSILITTQSGDLKMSGANGVDTQALVRASEAQRIRHEKELKGLAMQIEWMQARWEREANLRQDAAFAKHYLSLELEMRVAWYVNTPFLLNTESPKLTFRPCSNQADLQYLQAILLKLGVQKSPAELLADHRKAATPAWQRLHVARQGDSGPPRRRLGRALTVVRFVVRARLAAGAWARQERMRGKLAAAIEAAQKRDAIRRMRDDWRAGFDARQQQRQAAAA